MARRNDYIAEKDPLEHPPLLPCPFCGSEAWYQHSSRSTMARVRCKNTSCHASSSAQFGSTKSEAEVFVARQWNLRTTIRIDGGVIEPVLELALKS